MSSFGSGNRKDNIFESSMMIVDKTSLCNHINLTSRNHGLFKAYECDMGQGKVSKVRSFTKIPRDHERVRTKVRKGRLYT